MRYFLSTNLYGYAPHVGSVRIYLIQLIYTQNIARVELYDNDEHSAQSNSLRKTLEFSI